VAHRHSGVEVGGFDQYARALFRREFEGRIGSESRDGVLPESCQKI